MRITPLALLVPLLAGCAATSSGGPESAAATTSWSMDARLAESCCCDAICPCIVGSPPTRGYCEGNRLVEIVDGHFGGVDLDGVRLNLTFRIGEWTQLYFDETTANEEQVAATEKLLAEQKSFLFGELFPSQRVPFELERGEDKLVYAVPAARTEIEVMRGANDEPVTVDNLNTFRDYVQYVSVVVDHRTKKEANSFQHGGTNGFTARYRASSDDA
jgi:hypothetical protein